MLCALKRAQLLHMSLDTKVAKDGVNLSAGERQLLCFARALLLQTPIVVMDEPTASMDVATDEVIQQLVKREIRGSVRMAMWWPVLIFWHSGILVSSSCSWWRIRIVHNGQRCFSSCSVLWCDVMCTAPLLDETRRTRNSLPLRPSKTCL